jgi:hypothetical protein
MISVGVCRLFQPVAATLGECNPKMVLFYPFSMERIGLSGVVCGARVGGRRKSERDAMWISLFTLVCGVAVCLSVAAVMMERGGLQLLRR